MRLRLIGHAALGLAALFAGGARAADLSIGDDAPPLTVSKFVKGEAVEKFEEGKVYVVEFWATWCGPCRVSIPHLTELQKEYEDKGVRIIGVSVWESDPSEVEPFVEEMGEKMGYAVAKDDLGDDAGKGKMAAAWMDAAGEQGIPTAFIVKDAKIAWIGHPMSMDEPLAEIVVGEFDPESYAEERKQARLASEKLSEIAPRLRAAMQANKPEEALKILEPALEEVPALLPQLGMLRYTLLNQAGREDDARKAAEELIEASADEPQALNALAWGIIDPDLPVKPGEAQIQLALKAAEKANEATEGNDPAILDTLALAVSLSGDKARAVELQEKAVELAEKGGFPETMLGEMKQRLERFRKDDSE